MSPGPALRGVFAGCLHFQIQNFRLRWQVSEGEAPTVDARVDGEGTAEMPETANAVWWSINPALFQDGEGAARPRQRRRNGRHAYSSPRHAPNSLSRVPAISSVLGLLLLQEVLAAQQDDLPASDGSTQGLAQPAQPHLQTGGVPGRVRAEQLRVRRRS
jgi:hypothetical protein